MLQNPSGSNTLQRCMNPGLCLASRGDPVGAPRYGGYRVPAEPRELGLGIREGRPVVINIF